MQEAERAAELETTPIWKLTRARYQFLRGIKQPHIMEISLLQYARFSKRGLKAYQEKRAEEWDASGDCKVKYDRLVWEAYERKDFTLQTEGVSADAKTAVHRWTSETKKQETARKLKEAHVENRILSVDDAEIGDTVYTLYGSRYVEIVGKLKKSFKVKDETGRVYPIKAGTCQWLHYNELVKAVEEGRAVNPHRAQDKEPDPPPPATPAAATVIQQSEPETAIAASVTQFRAPLTTEEAPRGVTRERAEEIIREEMDRHGLRTAGWTYGFMAAQRVFGTCNETNKVLKFSLPILALNTEADLRECVRHEVAHAKAGHKAGHGRLWKAMALACGANPERTCGAHIVTPDNKYHATCQECGHVHKMTRVPKNTKYCGLCVRKNINPYMTRARKQEVLARFKLIWIEQSTGRSFENQDAEIITAQARTPAVEVERQTGREPEVWTVTPITHAHQPNLF